MQDFLIRPLPRTILFVVIFIALIVLPWWISGPVILGLTFYLPMYLEVLFWGFVFDTLYSQRYHFPYFYLTLAGIILIATLLVKDRIRT